MVTHIVLFRFASPKDADEAAEQLRSMRGKVPSLLELEVGVDFTRGERSYEVGLITRHSSREDLLAYQADPVHQAVAAFIKARSKGAASVDFEASWD